MAKLNYLLHTTIDSCLRYKHGPYFLICERTSRIPQMQKHKNLFVFIYYNLPNKVKRLAMLKVLYFEGIPKCSLKFIKKNLKTKNLLEINGKYFRFLFSFLYVLLVNRCRKQVNSRLFSNLVDSNISKQTNHFIH